jgi:hypothetical protein
MEEIYFILKIFFAHFALQKVYIWQKKSAMGLFLNEKSCQISPKPINRFENKNFFFLQQKRKEFFGQKIAIVRVGFEISQKIFR